jgi:hypothetical protein
MAKLFYIITKEKQEKEQEKINLNVEFYNNFFF